MGDGRFIFEGRLAIVGGGRMGEAIVKGLLDSGVIERTNLVVAEPSGSRRDELASAHHVECVEDSAQAVLGADVVILAVKPQVIEGVTESLSALLGGTLVVSIAAGVSSARLEALLPTSSALVRVMPNTPAMVGQGMSVVSGGSEATSEQVDLVRALFAELGRAIVLDERYQDIATAISGSGPAYVALMVDALARAGVRHGLTRPVAQELAIQTLRGTADLMEATGQHPQQLIDNVASPGGTTIAALEVLEALGFRTAIAEAVSAAVERARELAS
jgi:pyrroline-5-carboxylate reductase